MGLICGTVADNSHTSTAGFYDWWRIGGFSAEANGSDDGNWMKTTMVHQNIRAT